MSWVGAHGSSQTEVVLTPGPVGITCHNLVPFCEPQFPHLQNRDASPCLTGGCLAGDTPNIFNGHVWPV